MNKNIIWIYVIILCISVFQVNAQTTLSQCSGTAMPYKAVEIDDLNYYPDSLSPFFVNHLGRHGARYSTSPGGYNYVINNLIEAKKVGALTPCGVDILESMLNIKREINNKWGKLTSLGVAEQKGIAERLYKRFNNIFLDNENIISISTSVPRCISSMEAFNQELKSISAAMTENMSHGDQYNNILRFFDVDKDYLAYKKDGNWRDIYEDYKIETINPDSFIRKVFNSGYNISNKEKKDLYMSFISITQILPCAEIDNNFDVILSYDDNYNYWKTQNLRQYLLKSASTTGGDLPVKIAKPLLSHFISVADSVINNQLDIAGYFRFAHAETLLPFAAYMKISLAYKPNLKYNHVYKSWLDYNIAPMASNIQWIFYKGDSGRVYVQFLLNEIPVSLCDNADIEEYLIYDWGKIRGVLLQD